jgi:hypothetical protein
MECNRRTLLTLGLVLAPVLLIKCGPDTEAPDDPTARSAKVFRVLTARWEYAVPATFELYEDDTLIAETDQHSFIFERRRDNSTKCYKLRAIVDGAPSAFTDPVCITLTK